MLYVQLDANWVDDEAVMDAGWLGAGVHAGIMCIAKRLDTDGWVPVKTTRRYQMPDDVIDSLLELGLLERDGERVRSAGWQKRNLSKTAIEAKRAAKVRAAKAGNHSRYEHFGTVEDCRICYPENAQKPSVLAPAIAEPRTDLAEPSHPASPIVIHTTASPPATTIPPEQVENLRALKQVLHPNLELVPKESA